MTCGSVLNVWKRVDSYAKDGFTAVIHGKCYHEETKATSSQVTKYPSGKYLVVRDMAEAREVCAYIEGAGSGEQFADRKSTRLNSSHLVISYAVFCLKKKKRTSTI